MKQGVSAEFIRDMVHYHNAMYEALWDGIDDLEPGAFTSSNNFSGRSIRDHLLDQIADELFWLERLHYRSNYDALPRNAYIDRDGVYKLWNNTRLQFRAYIANTSDQGINDHVSDSKKRVSEVIVHLYNQGVVRRSFLHVILHESGVESLEQTYLEFFK